ncbi:hypothetical protein VitviT2T_011033 [Vitis vinifera]|nr:triacylglycerol lipase OBL1 [Vitis vinifera]WJZ92000.1 hypothetical protein VitviT2T_011033 [Vitis vinifera]|eukprot:XP_002277782.1 PREDICTED: uncharacterized protein LOC100242185 [Vitis vinifera]
MATGDCNKEFSTDYILLEPEKLNFYELIRILFPGDIEKRKFVDCLEGAESNFERRWIIFISISAQKFLQFVAKPLSWFGSAFETGLNLSSTNGGFGMLLLNCLRGNIQWPDKTSPTFSSFNGHLDKRVELDESIKPGDSKYYAALTMMSSKISYENKAFIKTTVEDEWKMEFLGSFDFWNDYQDKATTQAFILHDKTVDSDTIIVTFRGTETFDADAWCTDFDISWYEIPGVGKIHGGFMKALGLQKNLGWPKEIEQDDSHSPVAYYAIREMLRERLQANDQTKFLVTGHSLGAALAILFPAILALHEETWMLERLRGVYTFGQPRVGDPKFGEFTTEQLKEHNIPYFRFVYGNDLVPRLPYDNKALMFKHFGTCLYYNSFYEGKIVAEEPNKNYFSPLMAIPKTMNAVWELIRSFIIGHSKGKDYTEGWFLRAFRVLGLIVPGVSAHGPQDYVNATRLGSSALFLPHQIPTE